MRATQFSEILHRERYRRRLDRNYRRVSSVLRWLVYVSLVGAVIFSR